MPLLFWFDHFLDVRAEIKIFFLFASWENWWHKKFYFWHFLTFFKAKHTGAPVKPVKVVCPECDQEFNATMYFVQHYKYVHGGIPPGFEDKEKFMCDQCPSVFFNNLSLKLHYKTKHSDIIKDPAKVGRRNCPHCEKTFATYLSYKEHIKVRIMSFGQGVDGWN